MLVSSTAEMCGSNDYLEVALSVWIAISAFYTAPPLVGRVTGTKSWSGSAWSAAGTITVGESIAGTHCQSFCFAVRLRYHWPSGSITS